MDQAPDSWQKLILASKGNPANPRLPEGWDEGDLATAEVEIINFAKNSKAFPLLAHRLGCLQSEAASRAMRLESVTHDQRIASGSAYWTYERVMKEIVLIGSFSEQKRQEESHVQATEDPDRS
jgi:hypothetical protein